jgi:hypothetical protein
MMRTKVVATSVPEESQGQVSNKRDMFQIDNRGVI